MFNVASFSTTRFATIGTSVPVVSIGNGEPAPEPAPPTTSRSFEPAPTHTFRNFSALGGGGGGGASTEAKPPPTFRSFENLAKAIEETKQEEQAQATRAWIAEAETAAACKEPTKKEVLVSKYEEQLLVRNQERERALQIHGEILPLRERVINNVMGRFERDITSAGKLPSDQYDALRTWVVDKLKTIPKNSREPIVKYFQTELKVPWLQLSEEWTLAKADAHKMLKAHLMFLDLDDVGLMECQSFEFLSLSARANKLTGDIVGLYNKVSKLPTFSELPASMQKHLASAITHAHQTNKVIRACVDSDMWTPVESRQVAMSVLSFVYLLHDPSMKDIVADENIGMLYSRAIALSNPYGTRTPMFERLSAMLVMGVKEQTSMLERFQSLEKKIPVMRQRLQDVKKQLKGMFETVPSKHAGGVEDDMLL